MLKKEIATLFEEEHIKKAALLPFSACRVTNAALYERKNLVPESVLIFLIPYFSVVPENFSAYAAAEDYHYFAVSLYERLLDNLRALYPGGEFLGFADHSPIDERDAAIRAGLGVYGRNRLLLSTEYGSYQFIGEILSSLPPTEFGEVSLFPFSFCMACGECLSVCPTGLLRGEGDECLSAITQKKGELSPDEAALLRRVGTAWGCDECQKVCPYTKVAIARGTAYSEIPFFRENLITRLDTETVEKMPKEDFARRAFAWRGRETVLRNVKILEGK